MSKRANRPGLVISILTATAILGWWNFSPAKESGCSSPEFSIPRPDYVYAFPRDHGSHECFQTEWWYVTGHVFANDGRRFGYELTFFRRAIDSPDVRNNPSAWAMQHLYFAHFALTDEGADQFQFVEKISRAGIKKAGALSNTLDVWIDRWSIKAMDPDHQRFHLQAQARHFSIDLILESLKPPIIHGIHGVSKKGQLPDNASHYYSLTRLGTKGLVVVNGTSMAVNGLSWMDHEFGSGDLAQGLVGWDWFSLQLENNFEIMTYGLRREDGAFDPASSGTLIFPDGSSKWIPLDDMRVSVQQHWTSPVSGARYPNQWILSIPSESIELEVSPRMDNQELMTTRSTGVTYWEGAVDVQGRWHGQEIRGQGYVELTGYAEPYVGSGGK